MPGAREQKNIEESCKEAETKKYLNMASRCDEKEGACDEKDQNVLGS